MTAVGSEVGAKRAKLPREAACHLTFTFIEENPRVVANGGNVTMRRRQETMCALRF